MTRRITVVLGCLIVLFFVERLVAQEQPTRYKLDAKDIEESLGTEWFGVYFQGKKIGYFRSARERSDAGYVETLLMTMKLVSFGQKVEIQVTQTLEYENKAPFRLRRAESVQKDGKVNQTIQLLANDKGMLVTTITGKDVSKKQIARIDYTFEDALTSDVWLRRGPKVGAKITTRDFDLEDLKTDLTTNKLLATKTSLVAGVKVTFHELESFGHKTKLTVLSRHDAKGRLLSGVVAEVFEMRRETEEQAKNTEYSADIFVLGMAKIDKGLGDPTKVTSLIVEIEGQAGKALQSGPRQVVSEEKKGTYVCKIGKMHAPPVKATDKDIDENLQETLAYPITSPKVKAVLKEALGDAKTPQEKVQRLAAFVYDFIKPSLSASIPKLHDLLERKAGDCKSYALLFNTLARAAEIPSREVSGFLYVGDDVKAFGGHAWNEVVLDGEWVPIDASLNETEISATHIRLGTDRDSTNSALTTLGKLSFRLVEVKHR